MLEMFTSPQHKSNEVYLLLFNSFEIFLFQIIKFSHELNIHRRFLQGGMVSWIVIVVTKHKTNIRCELKQDQR